LLQFPNILTFRINLLGPLEIDDTFHEQLGLSCPRMQQLDLVATAPKQWPSRVTFEGLAQLANLCANLNDVGMHIAISYPMTVAADNCRRNNNTTKLSVGSWMLVDRRVCYRHNSVIVEQAVSSASKNYNQGFVSQ
jgi:hypothetical protein